MGTPEFSLHVLKKLIDDGHEIVSIYTKQNQPSGRGRKLAQNPIKNFGINQNIPVIQPANFKSDRDIKNLKSWDAEVAVIAAYGIILPKNILDSFKFGCLNLHPSVLPKYRGPSPVASAIMNNDSETGVSIMLLDEGMDSGPILSQEKTKILPNVSPNKTWEGFIGGVLSTTVIGYFMGFLTPLSSLQLIIISPSIAILGFMGDAILSAVKRDFGVKDMSNAIPGHGGILDRVDSLSTTASPFFHIVYFIIIMS